MNKLRLAAKWMWDHRGQNIWWCPAALPPANAQDPTNPQLNAVEAESVFRLVEDEKLIFPIQHPGDKQTAYLLNEVRTAEWQSFLQKMNPFYLYVIRPFMLLFRNGWAVVVWFVSTAIAAFLGAIIDKSVE